MKVTPQQVQSVLALPGPERFEHFVKTVADWQQVWGLYDEGWALAATDQGTPVFPLWPAREYAVACAAKEWSTHEPKLIELREFMDVLLPQLKADGVLPGVFFTPSTNGLTPTVDELVAALELELQNY